MPINLGSGAISGAYVGSTAVSAAYLGSASVYSFAPSGITGLQLWLDASDASTLYDATTGGSLVAADGGVARWEDKSGNDRHATQGTSGSRPVRKASVQNGLDGLRFDGSDDYLVAGTASMFTFLHSSTSSWFVIFRAGDVADPDTFYFLCGTAGTVVSPGGAYIRHETRNTLSQTGIAHISGGNGARTNNYRSGPGGNVYQVASLVSDQTESLAENRSFLRVNGGAAATESSSTEALDTSDPRDGFGIGALKGSSNTYGGFLLGDICEIIVYDSALSDTDREAVENYLMTKWAIT